MTGLDEAQESPDGKAADEVHGQSPDGKGRRRQLPVDDASEAPASEGADEAAESDRESMGESGRKDGGVGELQGVSRNRR